MSGATPENFSEREKAAAVTIQMTAYLALQKHRRGEDVEDLANILMKSSVVLSRAMRRFDRAGQQQNAEIAREQLSLALDVIEKVSERKN